MDGEAGRPSDKPDRTEGANRSFSVSEGVACDESHFPQNIWPGRTCYTISLENTPMKTASDKWY